MRCTSGFSGGSTGTLLLLVGLMPGCASMSQSEIKFLETRELDLGYDDAYRAAANGLFSLGYAINHSDKSSGILSARLVTHVAKSSVTFLLVLPMATISEGRNEEAVTFMLTPINKHRTQLRMKVVFDGKPIVDRKKMTKIWQRIEREAMLETKPARATRTKVRARPNKPRRLPPRSTP
ncbi:MAG: hypothetical protein ACE5E5_09445 [Phycisphaerae bacterium]